MKVVQQTSILAYVGILEELGERQKAVYKAIRELQVCNNTQIADELNLPISSITPRVNELRQKGVVVLDKKDYCHITNRLTMFWRVAKRL